MNPARTFIDTSGFYALIDRKDAHHEQAAELWSSLLSDGGRLYTSNYVALETIALAQNRLGFDAALVFSRDVLGVVEVLWVEASIHQTAVDLWLTAVKSRLSLVDCSSFVLMRKEEIDMVFGFDRHFAERGFTVIQTGSI